MNWVALYFYLAGMIGAVLLADEIFKVGQWKSKTLFILIWPMVIPYSAEMALAEMLKDKGL